MHRFHIAVSVVNIVAGLSFALLLWARPENEHPVWAGFSVVGGYFANVLAVSVAVVIGILLVVRTVKGEVRPFLNKHWLGLFNGLFVIAFWTVLFGIGRLFES
jgi:hypothetical protein